MYIAVYYPSTIEEYRLPININVLIREDKHQAFKKQIYTTNYRNLEKDLLLKENLRQSLRLLLVEAFLYNNLITIQLAKDLYVEYLSLFLPLLFSSKQRDLLRADAEAKDNEEDELDSILSSNIYILTQALQVVFRHPTH